MKEQQAGGDNGGVDQEKTDKETKFRVPQVGKQ